ncbi:MAG: hypothetical protein IPK03_16540 [Bacteroidetes bacterium]|nr:hypothetical protein [Bacteroidota bacterium]
MIRLSSIKITDHTSERYCSKCFLKEKALANEIAKRELEKAKFELNEIFDSMLIASIHLPPNWKFSVIGLVTGQSTTGTGIISEIASSFTDTFGMQSTAFNEKLANGEKIVWLN